MRIGFIDETALIYIAGLVYRGCKTPLKFLQLKNSADTMRRERPSLAFLVRNYALCCLEVYIRAENLSEERRTQLYKALAELDNFAVMNRKACPSGKPIRINGKKLDCDKKMEEIYKSLKYTNPRYVVYLIIAIAIIFGISDFCMRYF